MDPNAQVVPTVNGVSVEKLYASELAEGGYLGLDARYPAMTIYEYLDPKHSTIPGGMVNVNKYEEERFPYNIVVEMYAERGLALKVPNAVGSKFIAFVFPVQTPEAFKEQLQQLKKEPPKAVHHCFAYRIGLDGNQFRVSDDGEPSGSAGRPSWGRSTAKG